MIKSSKSKVENLSVINIWWVEQNEGDQSTTLSTANLTNLLELIPFVNDSHFICSFR